MESIIAARLAMIFTEWERRADSVANEGQNAIPALPDIGSVLISDYGTQCAAAFVEIAAEMDAAGLLPKLGE